MDALDEASVGQEKIITVSVDTFTLINSHMERFSDSWLVFFLAGHEHDQLYTRDGDKKD